MQTFIVKAFFLTPNRYMFAEKFVRSRSTLVSMLSDLRFVKRVRFFEQNCIVKWVIFFDSFSWVCDFLLENLELKKALILSTRTCDEYKKVLCLKLYSPKYLHWIFKSDVSVSQNGLWNIRWYINKIWCYIIYVFSLQQGM